MVDNPSEGDEASAEPMKPSLAEPRRSTFGGRRSLRSPSEALQPDQPPPPPKASKRKRRPLVATASGLLSFIGIAAIALAVAWSLGLQRINSPGPLTSDKVVTVQPGNDVSVVDQLADAGVIDNRMLMTATLWLEGDHDNVKAGEYMFKQQASLREVIDLLVSGKQILHAVTIPEGLTSEQVVERLRDNDVLVGDIAETPPEGSLMPETYKFARGRTRDQVIRSMEAKEKQVLAEVWARRSPDTPIHSPFELVTLASIVEKETGRADERPRVAGVFVNRLGRGMPLQSDPTIVYGLVGGKGTLGRGILKSELDQKTPYNTYQNTGLPPGPIANPGKAALEAVANPSRTKELYFVADGTGGHAFSDNLGQHQLNVQRWRQIEKDAKDKAGPDSDKTAPPGALRNNQHGAADEDAPVYGGLDPAVTGIVEARPARVTAFAVDGFSNSSVTQFSARAGGSSRPGSVATATDFNELDIEVGGVRSKADPATWGYGDDGGPSTPSGSAPSGSSVSFPVSPQLLADQKARALALGLQPGSSQPTDAVASASPPDAVPSRGIGKGKIIDASEGTAFDPLRDRTYDLSSAKVVPVLKPLPPLQPSSASSFN